MKLAKIPAAVAALSLLAAPVMAQAATQPLPARAQAELDEAEYLSGGFLVPALAIIAIILGILAATGGDDDELPRSP